MWYHVVAVYKETADPTLRKSGLLSYQNTAVASACRKTMITVFVRDYNQVSKAYYESILNSLPFHKLRCPCGHSGCLTIHGYYRRSVFLPGGVQEFRICRVRCPVCGHTHAILLSSMVPCCRIPMAVQHRIVCAYEEGSDRNAACENNDPVDENCVKSVILPYRRFWLQRLRSEGVRPASLPGLLRDCFSFYSMQFMQIRRTANILFLPST